MGVAGLLTSELYGLRSSLDPDTLDALDRKRQLTIKEDKSATDQEELAKLNEELGRLDFTHTVRDPLYKPFVNAMAQLEKEFGLGATVMTPAQVKEREHIAIEIVRALLGRSRN